MITIVGSLNMDLVVNTERIPRLGETIMGQGFKQIPGGKGGNQADAAVKLGAQVNMIGCIGQDYMGEYLLTALKADGVGTAHIFRSSSAPTGIAVITVEASGNNAITVAPGANYELTAADVLSKKKIIQEADILLLQLETKLETVETALKLAKEAGRKTILNPAPAVSLTADILKNTDILTPNETELEVLSGFATDTEEHIAEAGRKLIAMGAGELVVTLGEKGCMHITEQSARTFPAYRVKAVDTTAAGDSFNAALAVCLDQGKSMEEAIQFAMKVGAMTVTQEGAQTSLPYKREVDGFDSWLQSRQ